MYTHQAKPDSPLIEASEPKKPVHGDKVQHLSYAQGTHALNPMHKPDYDTQRAAFEPAVQRKGEGPIQGDVHEAAKRGTSGSGSSLPHLDAIQHSFGRHDVSGISAYTGGSAADACKDMGAQAFATGNAVAFGSSPDLHTAAHEAAHVVQQRAGVSLRGGVGAAGDTYEQHADRVADQVVQGKSAESLLDKFAGPTVQQSNAVQKRENTPETTDPVVELGNRLWREFPNGVHVSLYDPDDPELVNQGQQWAKTYNGIGSKSSLAAASLKVGVGIPVKSDLQTNLAALETSLTEIAAKATEKPEGATGPGPAKISTLAIFAHGTNDWFGIGTSLTDRNVASVTAQIASSLTSDVNVILYGCSIARGADEENSWKNTTTMDGGDDSLAGLFRDALVDQGKDEATVWGHTEVGHTTRNFTLREFSGSDGTKTDGFSYLSKYVWNYQTDGLSAVEKAVKAKGYEIKNEASFKKFVDYYTKSWIYKRYSSAMSSLKYQERHLAEAAPIYPAEVGKLIKDFAITTWPEKEAYIANRAITRLKLKPSATPSPAN